MDPQGRGAYWHRRSSWARLCALSFFPWVMSTGIDMGKTYQNTLPTTMPAIAPPRFPLGHGASNGGGAALW